MTSIAAILLCHHLTLIAMALLFLLVTRRLSRLFSKVSVEAKREFLSAGRWTLLLSNVVAYSAICLAIHGLYSDWMLLRTTVTVPEDFYAGLADIGSSYIIGAALLLGFAKWFSQGKRALNKNLSLGYAKPIEAFLPGLPRIRKFAYASLALSILFIVLRWLAGHREEYKYIAIIFVLLIWVFIIATYMTAFRRVRHLQHDMLFGK